MKIVETNGLYHYNVIGEHEAEAAAELEAKLDIISRDYHSSYTLDDIADARKAIVEKYGVLIEASSDPADFPRKQTPQARYDAINTAQVMLKLNRRTDADILAKLSASGNRQGYIKALIRADIEKNGI